MPTRPANLRLCCLQVAKHRESTSALVSSAQRYGPYTFASLLRAAERGVVDPGDGGLAPRLAEWHIAREVSGLFEQEQMPARGYQGEDVDSPNRDGLARNVMFSVLTVLMIVVGAGCAIWLGVIRVTFMF